MSTKARRTLLAVARRAGLLVGYPCRGEGVCGRCTVQVVGGEALLPPRSPQEDLLAARERLARDERLACLVTPPSGATLRLRAGGRELELVVPGPPPPR